MSRGTIAISKMIITLDPLSFRRNLGFAPLREKQINFLEHRFTKSK
jgi:hypothetical protein